jgi:hypothetical protein
MSVLIQRSIHAQSHGLGRTQRPPASSAVLILFRILGRLYSRQPEAEVHVNASDLHASSSDDAYQVLFALALSFFAVTEPASYRGERAIRIVISLSTF